MPVSNLPEGEVIAVTEPIRISLGLTACYLLGCDGGYLLIDTGYPWDYRRFLKGLDGLGISAGLIRFMVLTHNHHDHVGFAAQLRRAAGCRLIVHSSGLTGLAAGHSQEVLRPANLLVKALINPLLRVQGSFIYEPVEICKDDIVLSGDDHGLLADIGIRGSILHTPGHTKDSITLIAENGKAFVGDAAMNLPFLFTNYRPLLIGDPKAVKESWHRIVEAGAKTIFPSHGKPFPCSRLGT